MGLETGTYVNDLVSTNPVVGDNVAEGDDHLRLIKAVLQATFPSHSRAHYLWTASAVSADQTPGASDEGKVYAVDATAAARSVTLPSAPTVGYRIAVVKTDSSANAVTVTRGGSDTINGATSRALSYQYQAELYVYVGSNVWMVVAISHPRMMIGPSSGTDERVVRWDGTGFVFQSSPVGISDTGAVTGTASVTPASSDGGALGSAVLMYSDLFLASGGVINWDNGDVTITHGTNTLAFAGAINGYSFDTTLSIGDGNNYFRLSGTNPGWVVDNTDEWTFDRTNNIWKPYIGSAIVAQLAAASLSPGVSDVQALGTTALMWSDLFLASGAVINFNNGNVTLTHAAASLTLAGATTFSMGTSVALTVGTIELGHASANTLSASSGDLSIEGTVVKKVGKETIGMPAGAMIPRTTNGAASATVELATNDVMISVLDFDASTEEGAGFWVAMPKSYNNSTVTFSAQWTAASGSGGVAWGLAAYAFSDDDAMDTAVSGQQIVTDTLITANDMHITAESAAITIGGTPAAGDLIYFEITREVANGSDTLAVDARLLGIRLHFTSNASTDA